MGRRGTVATGERWGQIDGSGVRPGYVRVPVQKSRPAGAAIGADLQVGRLAAIFDYNSSIYPFGK